MAITSEGVDIASGLWALGGTLVGAFASFAAVTAQARREATRERFRLLRSHYGELAGALLGMAEKVGAMGAVKRALDGLDRKDPDYEKRRQDLIADDAARVTEYRNFFDQASRHLCMLRLIDGRTDRFPQIEKWDNGIRGIFAEYLYLQDIGRNTSIQFLVPEKVDGIRNALVEIGQSLDRDEASATAWWKIV